MTLNFLELRLVASASLVVALAGCPGKPGETDTDGEGSSSAGSSAADETTAGHGTTSGAPTTGADSEAGSGTSGGGGATDGDETTAATTGPGTTTSADTGTSDTGVDPAIDAACTAGCQHIFECEQGLPGTIEDCKIGCLESWGAPSCGDAGVTFLQCLAGMTCPELIAYIEMDEPGVCAEAAEAADAACGGQVCEMSAGGGQGECSIGRDCGDGLQELQCDGTTCTCFDAGVPGESCEDEGVCALDVDAQSAVAQTCCGWDWS